MTLNKNPLENIVGKGENAGDQHFLRFPQCSLPIPTRISVFKLQLFCRLQMLSILTSLFLLFGKELICVHLSYFIQTSCLLELKFPIAAN